MVLFGSFFKFSKNLVNLNSGTLILVVSCLKSETIVKFLLRDPAILVDVHSIHQLDHVVLFCLNAELLYTIY